MKELISILRFIARHPLASRRKMASLGRFFRWQFSQLLFPHPVLYEWVENSVLVAQKGMAGATGNIYTGLMEFEDMGFVLHLLRKNDFFGDIGANIGAYSILASVNAEANTIAIEPIPQTFSFLCRNIRVNNAEQRINVLQSGVGEREEELFFTSGLDTVNHVLTEEEKNLNVASVRVAVNTVDNIFKDQCPVLIKIDAEGFEWPILQGAQKTFARPELKAILIEINGSGSKYGISDSKIHQFFIDKGFKPYRYDPFTRNMQMLSTYGPFNTIYVRDFEWVNQRVGTSRKYEILGTAI